MKKSLIFSSIAVTLVLVLGVIYVVKYHHSPEMQIEIEEIATEHYPEDPSILHDEYGKYRERSLRLKQMDDTHFTFAFVSEDPKVATVTLKNLDLSLWIPTIPEWAVGDEDLEVISLVEREWNRQQVRFTPGMENLEITGGDGFEESQVVSVELARNCLNAGLWELMLYVDGENGKELYYHGWFDFPLGYYKKLFETFNETSYWGHWFRLEHWFDPEGTPVDLERLRTITGEKNAKIERIDDLEEITAGEQKRKKHLKDQKTNLLASFIPPGRYSAEHPWKENYEKIDQVEGCQIREVVCPQQEKELVEFEIQYISSRDGRPHRLVIGGIDLSSIPVLSSYEYHKGLYMPMGFGVPPFNQPYEELQDNPPHLSTYYSFLLDEEGNWVNHHEASIDGPVIHRDLFYPDRYHIYLLSYERAELVSHFVVEVRS